MQTNFLPTIVNIIQFIKKNKYRLLSMDFGEKNIGLAVSDENITLASPLKTMKRISDRQVLAELPKIIKDYRIGAIVIGDPKRISGEETHRSLRVIQLADFFQKRLSLPFILWDERFSTQRGYASFQQSAIPYLERKQNIDKVAACIILEEFIQCHIM